MRSSFWTFSRPEMAVFAYGEIWVSGRSVI
jgi:hypothetical protein